MALPLAYERTCARTLEEVALAATDLDVPLVPFWPLRGAAYDGRAHYWEARLNSLMAGTPPGAKAGVCAVTTCTTSGGSALDIRDPLPHEPHRSACVRDDGAIPLAPTRSWLATSVPPAISERPMPPVRVGCGGPQATAGRAGHRGRGQGLMRHPDSVRG